MPKILESDDHVYQAIQQEDGNFVVYVKNGMIPVWDAWSHVPKNNSTPDIPVNIPPDVINSNPIDTNSNQGIPVLVYRGCNSIGMSYWRNINQHKNQNILQLFLSINDELTIFIIEKSTLRVLNERRLGIHHTGEGCYFSAIKPNILFVPTGNTLFSINIDNNENESVWTLGSGHNLWQCHNSYDDQVHSATIQDSNYKIIGWGVKENFARERIFPVHGDNPDECQIDKSGRFLTIKEDNYNKIIDLLNNSEKIIQNEEGAVGHSDCGFGCILGENDMSQSAGALDLIDFNTGEHKFMYSTGIWNMGYVSFTNANPNKAGQKVLVSTPKELISVNFDWPHQWKKVCDNLTESQVYEHRPKANLCPEGEYATWTALVGGKINAYIVKVPQF